MEKAKDEIFDYLKHEVMSDLSLIHIFIIAPPRMAYYMEYSTRIYQIYLKYIAPEDIVEMCIRDRAWGEGAYKAVGVKTDQVVFGGGNIHCITQQEPAGK